MRHPEERQDSRSSRRPLAAASAPTSPLTARLGSHFSHHPLVGVLESTSQQAALSIARPVVQRRRLEPCREVLVERSRSS